jgi:hypothetical protein
VIGGTVTGLTGSGLVLATPGQPDLSVAAGATSFGFATPVASGTAYAVSVKQQPSSPDQTCVVASGTGTVDGADVITVRVTCVNAGLFLIGGTVTGLSGSGLVLATEGQPDLSVTAGATSFAFATPVASGAAYAVSVKQQPTGPAQDCRVIDASGVVQAADVNDIAVDCAAPEHSFTRYADGPRAVVLVGGSCSGTAFVGRRQPSAPVYVLTAGHCYSITNGDDVFVDLPYYSEAQFNRFADAPAAALFSVPLSRVVYSTMWGHDLTVLKLDATQQELATLGVDLPALAAAVPASGSAFTYGYRYDEPLMRRTDCALGPRTWLLEWTWSWMSSGRLECPVPDYIRDGSSGSPVFAGDTDEFFGVLNTGSENPAGPPCVLDQPCELLGTGPENVVDASYFQDATRLYRCFTDAGVLDLSLPSCGLPGSRFWLQASPGVAHGLTVNANQPGVPVGTYRYKVSAVEGFDPSAVAGYGAPTDSVAFTFSPVAAPYVVTAVSELDFNAAGIEPLALHTYPVTVEPP